MINLLDCFFGTEGHAALDTKPYSFNWSQEIFIVHVPIDSSIHYPVSYTVRLQCQTCQAGRQFVSYLWWSLMWPTQGKNPQPTTWKVDTLA